MGRELRNQLWANLEQEFGEPITEIIKGLRDIPNSWRTVAGALGIARSTLKEWRHELNLPLNQHENVYDPSSLSKTRPLDLKAQKLGYDNIQNCIVDLRLNKQLTIKQAAKIVGCHHQTIAQNSPNVVKGLYNRSDDWWKSRREQAAQMTRRSQEKRRKNTKQHPWNKDNDMGVFK